MLVNHLPCVDMIREAVELAVSSHDHLNGSPCDLSPLVLIGIARIGRN